MVLLAKFLLLLFMIIVVHGNIVVDVEQKVNIDGCCNGCCPCNSCDCIQDTECPGTCQLKNAGCTMFSDPSLCPGKDCTCCYDPCRGYPKYDPETCTKTICKEDGTIIEIIEEKPCGNNARGCCFLPNTDPKKMVCPGYNYVGGCLVVTCENSIWVPSFKFILGHCLKCIAFNDPHFRAFSGAEFDWHIPCNHALTQKGSSHNPDFGVFMDFTSLTQNIAVVGPATYEEKIGTIVNTVKMVPASFVVAVNSSPKRITTTLQHFVGPNIWAIKEFITGQVAGRSSGCIWIYCGNTQLVIQRCAEQITIWAPQWGHGGYPKLGGLCSTNDQVRDLVARDGNVYPDPGAGNPCDASFGYGWQRNKLHQSKTECPKKKTNSGKRKKRQAGDPQTVCSNFTNSPYHDECLEIVENSTLTGPNAEMFKRTCMFDLCVVVEYVDNKTLTKEQMAEQIRQITAEVKNQEDKTVGWCEALGGVLVGGICLEFHTDEKLNWTMAKDSCAASGSLAILDPNSVAYAVENYTMEHFKGMIFYAGGYRHAGDSEIWKWLNGKNFQKHFPWYHGEPNNAGGKEDCLAIYPYGYNDCECDKPEHYICELDLE